MHALVALISGEGEETALQSKGGNGQGLWRLESSTKQKGIYTHMGQHLTDGAQIQSLTIYLWGYEPHGIHVVHVAALVIAILHAKSAHTCK